MCNSSFLGLEIVQWEEMMDKDLSNSIKQIIALLLTRMIFYEQNKYINGFNARRKFDPKIGPL